MLIYSELYFAIEFSFREIVNMRVRSALNSFVPSGEQLVPENDLNFHSLLLFYRNEVHLDVNASPETMCVWGLICRSLTLR